MQNTICNIILSILETKDVKFVEKRFEILAEQLSLNEVEKKIVKDVNNSLHLGEVLSKEFISDKYSYYVESDDNIIPSLLSRDAIDSAIADIRVRQAKQQLSREMLELGSNVSTMTPKELRERFSKLHSNALVESRGVSPTNSLTTKKDAYGDLTRELAGLSLLLPKVEEHAGKATKGNMISILAFTGSFKSTYSLNLAYENAIKGHNILYLSLEATSTMMIDRLVINHIARNSRRRQDTILATEVRDKTLKEDQQSKYNEMHNDLVEKLGKHFILWDSTDIEFNTLLDMQNNLRLADKMFMETTGKGLDAVVVDQLSLLKYTLGSGRKASYDGAILNDWVSFFREQALNFLDDGRQIVVFMVSQTSRESFAEASKKKKRGRYDASCASDSHELERSSCTMITLFNDTENKNTLLVNIPKARQGFMPENPIQVEAYGEYFHVGPLSFGNETIKAEDFESSDFDLEDIL